jgi:PAS domain S-box-containing protein
VQAAGDQEDELSGRDLEELLEERSDDLYERAPVAYMSTLLDGTFVKVNETLLRWTGHERDDLLHAKRLHDLLAPGARIYYETHYAPLLQLQGEVREVAVELLRADGSRLPVLLNSTLVRDDSGEPRVVRTTCFDASERRRYERELLRARADAEARARAAHALEYVTDGVVLVGEDGRIAVMNPAAERIFGRVVGRPASTIEALGASGAPPVRARAGDRPAPSIVPTAVAGREVWLEIRALRAGDAVVYTVRDVTDDRRLEQLRTEVVAVVSHELRTPLTGVYGAAQTLLERDATLSQEARREMLAMLVEQTRRLTAIVDQMLLAGRIDSGNISADIAVFDAADVLDGLVQSVAADARHRLVVDAGDGARVRADLDRLRQVLTNLVDNALKYSTGPVNVCVGRRGLSVRFAVTDEGEGIPRTERSRIFEKFYRLDPDQTRGVGGTGLGLYIARELVHRMGGRIGLASRDRGTTFYVDVPAP